MARSSIVFLAVLDPAGESRQAPKTRVKILINVLRVIAHIEQAFEVCIVGQRPNLQILLEELEEVALAAPAGRAGNGSVRPGGTP
ncbi:hypothetical protein FHS85_002215 [Rhodoligotrophos appendicifer]|uniref:hypothetical protein n=1 Tax=Rhodoligotrophos appendicifer TaxID=987056 RepID=UPI00147900EE|nr:hypothetical protein [Rhodoligotrophos appendicifer]